MQKCHVVYLLILACLFSVQTEQKTTVEKCTVLETKMKENMEVLQNGQNDILDFKKQLQVSFAKVIYCC